MKKQLGNFVVLFKPGVVTGIHNEREIKLRMQPRGRFLWQAVSWMLNVLSINLHGIIIKVIH